MMWNEAIGKRKRDDTKRKVIYFMKHGHIYQKYLYARQDCIVVFYGALTTSHCLIVSKLFNVGSHAFSQSFAPYNIEIALPNLIFHPYIADACAIN